MEEYKIIKDYEGYAVSNFGNVKYNTSGRIINQHINKNGYCQVSLTNDDNKSKNFKIHRLVGLAFIPNPENKPCIDHIDNNKLNNNVDNLRWATFTENNQNMKLSKNNTSGFKGVSFCKRSNKWQSSITINNKRIYLGYFENKEDAIKARQEASSKYFGEYQNNCEKNI
jgi:hypothetical protein